MRVAGVCLAAVIVMSGSVAAASEGSSAGTADPAETASRSTLELKSRDFRIRFSATPRRVVLGPDGGQSNAAYRIVVRHPRGIDQVRGVRFRFERGDGRRPNHFSMRGSVVNEPSATKTVLSGRTTFDAYTPKRWGQYTKRANPGLYTIVEARVSVTEDGESTSVTVDPPLRTIKVRYVTRTVIDDSFIRKQRVLFEGKALGYEGIIRYGSPGDQMSALPDRKLKVFFRPRGASEPRVVATTKTNGDGLFSVLEKNHGPGRWWIRFPGDWRLDASRSIGYGVAAS